jgi:4-deoxy-L-threo-5-hexosulose-uronate ketol-isomerase
MQLDTRHATHPDMIAGLDTAKLRAHYLVTDLFRPDDIALTFSHVERMVIGGAMPVSRAVTLTDCPGVTQGAFLAARELGVINIGGPGSVTVGNRRIAMKPRDGLYVPMGTDSVSFASDSADAPAKYYLASTPAQLRHELVEIPIDRANPMPMGAQATANERTIYQYINPDVCRSSQLLMGLTALKAGNVWNTMPPHRHERRSEFYFYFGLAAEARVFHLMGEPSQTRHLVVANEQAVISPPWSIHTGVGTANYAFIWAMGGENVDYRDMGGVPIAALR